MDFGDSVKEREQKIRNTPHCVPNMGHSMTVWDQRSELEFTKDWNGIDHVTLKAPRGASTRVSLHGGQVVSWKNERGEELLFTSSKAIFKPPKAMRGGIPICFPQFGNCGSLEQHGFARNKTWSIDNDPPPLHPNDSRGKVSVDLLLKPSEDDLKCWPHWYGACRQFLQYFIWRGQES